MKLFALTGASLYRRALTPAARSSGSRRRVVGGDAGCVSLEAIRQARSSLTRSPSRLGRTQSSHGTGPATRADRCVTSLPSGDSHSEPIAIGLQRCAAPRFEQPSDVCARVNRQRQGERAMTMKSFSLGAIAFGVMIWTGACAKETPTAPSIVSGDVSGARTADLTSTPTVTLLPDLTARPAQVTVAVGDTVLFANQSGRALLLRS